MQQSALAAEHPCRHLGEHDPGCRPDPGDGRHHQDHRLRELGVLIKTLAICLELDGNILRQQLHLAGSADY
jgi:hypothetical protein